MRKQTEKKEKHRATAEQTMIGTLRRKRTGKGLGVGWNNVRGLAKPKKIDWCARVGQKM